MNVAIILKPLTLASLLGLASFCRTPYFVVMTPGKKYTLMTSGFYLLLFAIVPLLERYSPSGQCNPGAGMMLILFIPLFSALGFVISFAVRAKGNRAFMGPAIINGCFFVASLVLFNLGRLL